VSLGSASPGSRTLGLYVLLPKIKDGLPVKVVMSVVSAFFIVAQFNLDQVKAHRHVNTAILKTIQFDVNFQK
jgi:hypothetical protein